MTPTGQSQATTITHYGYDATNVVREWEENIAGVLNVSATYLLGPSGPMYKRPANAADVRWYVYDGLGSVVGEVDVSGNVTSEKKHDVFGLRRGTVGTEKSRHGFVGGLGHYSDDETGLGSGLTCVVAIQYLHGNPKRTCRGNDSFLPVL